MNCTAAENQRKTISLLIIPSSQLRAGLAGDTQIDSELEVKILEADPKRNKLILSQRQVYAQQRDLESRGVLQNSFKQKFRRRPAWNVDWEQPPEYAPGTKFKKQDNDGVD